MIESNMLNKLNPNIRLAMYHRASNLRLKPRIIFDYELLYLSKGRLKVEIDNTEYLISPGTILLFKPGKLHEFITLDDEEAHMPHVHFDAIFYDNFEHVPINFKPIDQCNNEEKTWIREDILEKTFSFPDIISVDNHDEIFTVLSELISIFERGDRSSAILQKSLMLKILHLIYTGLEAKKDSLLFKNSKGLEEAAKYIIEHYNEKIYKSHLSKIACLSLYHFERLFKKRYGISPQAFQIRYRLEKSKELIKFTQMSFSCIAEKVGYSDIHSFNKAFKKVNGISPSKFREKL